MHTLAVILAIAGVATYAATSLAAWGGVLAGWRGPVRTLAALLAIAGVGTYAASSLFALRTAWGAAVAVLVAGGVVASIGVILRNAPRAPAPRRHSALPRDPGFPRAPQGAPYRGPH